MLEVTVKLSSISSQEGLPRGEQAVALDTHLKTVSNHLELTKIKIQISKFQLRSRVDCPCCCDAVCYVIHHCIKMESVQLLWKGLRVHKDTAPHNYMPAKVAYIDD